MDFSRCSTVSILYDRLLYIFFETKHYSDWLVYLMLQSFIFLFQKYIFFVSKEILSVPDCIANEFLCRANKYKERSNLTYVAHIFDDCLCFFLCRSITHSIFYSCVNNRPISETSMHGRNSMPKANTLLEL